MFEKLGGRKLAACLVILVVVIAVVLIKGDLPETVADMLKYLITTYVAGNVGTDLVSTIAAKREGSGDSEGAPAAASINDVKMHTDYSVQQLYMQMEEALKYQNDLRGELSNNVDKRFTDMEIGIGRLVQTIDSMQKNLEYVVKRVPPLPQGTQRPAMEQPRPVQSQAKPVEVSSEPIDFTGQFVQQNLPNAGSSLLGAFSQNVTVNPKNVTNQNPLF